MNALFRYRVFIGIVAVGVGNFVAFAVIASLLGGDAVNGHVEGGRYFVNGRGQSFEVSHAVYIYSYLHVVSVWITHLSMMLATVWMIVASQFGFLDGKPKS